MKKQLSFEAALLLLTTLAWFVAGRAGVAAEWHVHLQTGADRNSGSVDSPLATIQAAINAASPGDTIHLHPARSVYRQSGSIRGKSGITIEGNGVTLDGADPLPEGGWETVEENLFRRRLPRTAMDRHLLVVRGVMERMGRTQSANSAAFPPISELRMGQFCFQPIDERDGWLYVRGSTDRLEWATRVNGIATSGVCRKITIRNLNARNFLNDGFNVHGDTREMLCENIDGYDCFDEGFSAHDTCECTIVNGRFWGNENGVADVNSAETVYHRSEFRGNVNIDVLLVGKSHRLVDCKIINSTTAAAVVAGPRSAEQTFELTLEQVSISTVDRTDPARVRINGGKLNITDCVFENVSFIPLGAELKAHQLRINGSAFKP